MKAKEIATIYLLLNAERNRFEMFQVVDTLKMFEDGQAKETIESPNMSLERKF